MRHRRKNNHLGRKKGHREAMLSNMATSLIMHKRIYTTVPKAKELRRFVEPLITRSKEDTTHSRRVVFSALKNKYAVTELFQTVSQKVGDRPGGYTRIIKTGYRLGDNAPMCFIELVDFNENMLQESKPKRTRTRRSRKKSAAKAAGAEALSPETPVSDVERKEEGKAAKAKGKVSGESAKKEHVEAKAEKAEGKTTGKGTKEAKSEAPEAKTAAEAKAAEAPQGEGGSSEQTETGPSEQAESASSEKKEDDKKEGPQAQAETEADEDTKS
jgi:large subunit ribosomal protein L17